MNDIIVQRHVEGYKRRQREYKELFDLDVWRKSASLQLILDNTDPKDSILEIGCLTGHHLILLAEMGYLGDLVGVDFVKDAIDWAKKHSINFKNIDFYNGAYPADYIDELYDSIILFDVIEHIHNKETFLNAVVNDLKPDGKVLILVPKGDHYCGPCHVNFFPTSQCLFNLLSYYFKDIAISEVDNGTKFFATCQGGR